MTDWSLNRRNRATIGLVALLFLLTACGGPSGTGGRGVAGTVAYEPVTVHDCTGREVVFDSPPRRVVALTTSVLEMLFWLGVQDRIVGIGSPPKPGAFPDEFDTAVQRLPKLAGEYTPGAYKPVPREQLLAARPDFVIGGFSSNFDADGATGQQELADAGVRSYLALSTSCSAATDRPRTDLDLVYQDLTNLGRIFGVSERAGQLVARMRAKTEQVAAAHGGQEPVTVFPFEFDEGTQTPYAPGNRQAVNAVIGLAGGRNIFGDLDEAYEKVSWEQVAARDPQVVLLIIYDTGDAQANEARFAEAEAFARTFPALAGTSAVREGRFARLLYEEGSNGGVRNADAVVSLARQLHPEHG